MHRRNSAFHGSDRRARAPTSSSRAALSLDKFGDPLIASLRSRSAPAISADLARHVRCANTPDEKPIIAPNYLSTDDDRQVGATPSDDAAANAAEALAKYRPTNICPPSSHDDASLPKPPRYRTTIFHPRRTGNWVHRISWRGWKMCAISPRFGERGIVVPTEGPADIRSAVLGEPFCCISRRVVRMASAPTGVVIVEDNSAR